MSPWGIFLWLSDMARASSGAGQFIDRVASDQLSSVADGYGNLQQSFVEQFQTRAGFTWLRGGEDVMGARLEGQQPAVVRVRVSTDTRRVRADWQMRDVRSGIAYSIRG